MKLRGFLVIIILGAAIYLVLHYVESGGDSDLPEKIQSINRVGDTTTEMNMKALQREIVAYMTEFGDTPPNLERIHTTKPWLKGMADAWGTPFNYRRIDDSSFLLRSAGKDMKFGTADDIVLEY